MARQLTQLAKVQYLSERVISILGCNPGPHTLQGTNTYLVGNGAERILVDTGQGNVAEYNQLLTSVLQTAGATIKSIIITHWHPDHIGGLSDVRGLLKKDVPAFKLDFPEGSPKPVAFTAQETSVVADRHLFEVEGASLTAIWNPGHTYDHMILWLKEESAIFTGDTILGEGTTEFQNLGLYMNSLHKIKEMKPKVLYPGHGPAVLDPAPYIDYYITHRQEREEQVLAFLRPGHPVSAAEIVQVLYKDYPLSIHRTAQHVVLLHLDKLRDEEKVACAGDREDPHAKWHRKLSISSSL